MIVDYFMFHNEVELLQLRYHMLKYVVDKFVISEASTTFTGKPKEFRAKELVDQLDLDPNKFIFLSVRTEEEFLQTEKIDIWNAENVGRSDKVEVYTRQRTQRDAIGKILDNFPDDTVFICGDIDEIPKPSAVKWIASQTRNQPNNFFKIPLVLLEGGANQRVYNENDQPVPWSLSLIFTTKNILKHTPSKLRADFECNIIPLALTENGKVIQDLGWHFTWMGDKERKQIKAQSCAHSVVPNLINNVTEETKKELQNLVDEKFGEIVRYHHKPYDIKELPVEIFQLPNVKKFLLPNLDRVKTVDCFMYFNESELLELRYHLLKDYVDLFVVIESNVTFSGNPKEYTAEGIVDTLKLDKKKFRFLHVDQRFISEKDIKNEDKIYSKVAGDENGILKWVRERHQRNYVVRILHEFDDECAFIVSDADEIIAPHAVNYITRLVRENPSHIIKVPLILLESRADRRIHHSNNNPMMWDKSMFIATAKQLMISSPNSIRGETQAQFKISYIAENNKRVEDLGWHFTWMGDNNRIKDKALNFGHSGNLAASNTISPHTAKKLTDLLGKTVNNKNYTIKEFNKKDLPKEIFDLPTVRKFLLPSPTDLTEETMLNMKKEKISAFVLDPKNPVTNFELGYSYECIGQTAAAVSFYLRTAELTEDTNFQYECLLRLANCFTLQKNRNFTVTHIINRAITVNPHRPEAYFVQSNNYLEAKDYQNAYLYSSIGLALLTNDLVPFKTEFHYPGLYALEYINAISGYYVGFYKQSKEKLLELQDNKDISLYYKEKIKEDLSTVIKI